MDRNCLYGYLEQFPHVALRKESVDRNHELNKKSMQTITSLSARRAWIEIPLHDKDVNPDGSLSARRAWIEISFGGA